MKMQLGYVGLGRMGLAIGGHAMKTTTASGRTNGR
jgi:6-phosphogluconate dehydrogenase (decarboxylating)